MAGMFDPMPAAPATPEQPKPAVVPPGPKQSSFLKFGVVVVVLLVAAAAAYYLWLKPQPQQAAQMATTARTAKVTRGPLVKTIRVCGQTSARVYANITAPRLQGRAARGSMVLLKLTDSGTRVGKGDVVVQFDPQSMLDTLDDLRDTLQSSRNSFDKTTANQALEWEQLQQTVRVAKASWQKSVKEAQAAEVQTEITQELLKLSVEESNASYQQQLQSLPNQKTSEEAALRISQIGVQQSQLDYQQGQRNIEKFTIKAPMDGLAVVQMVNRGGDMKQILLGDQVQPGQLILKVVDPASMQVEALINQADSGDLRIGQTVKVGLDAFPDAVFNGKVYSIGAMAVGSTRSTYFLRSVPVKVSIEGADPRLIPDLSAYGDVTIQKTDNALQVPRAAIHSENGKSYVFVKTGEQKTGTVFEKRPVDVGLRNSTQAVVISGLQEGEEVRVD